MKDPNDIVVVVQARLSSQRVPQKMIRPFAGTTLMDICLQKVVDSHIPLRNFFVSVYEPELKQIAYNHGVQIFHRSEKSAKADAGLADIYEWYTLPYKYCILISACLPMLTVETINKFYTAYMVSKYDGMFAVIEKKTYYWNYNGECITPLKTDVMDTKNVEPIYEAAHVLYASALNLIPQGKWMGNFTQNSPSLFVVPEVEALDIDYEWQFNMMEKLYEPT